MIKSIVLAESVPIKFWLDVATIDEGALEQAKNLANLPFVFKHIAIMPDAHQGYGMPIGGVMATRHAIIPNAVGVDIGCGMCAVKASLTELDTETLKKILGEIRRVIPVGFNKHEEEQDESLMPYEAEGVSYVLEIVDREYGNAMQSLGTLGGGNHFIEVQRGSDGYIWLMVHSGSRNLGKRVADHYNKIAVHLNERWFSQVPKKWGLAFLPRDSEEGMAYLREMGYCVDFALANRQVMMDRIQTAVNLVTEQDIIYDEAINIAHNYASLENHFGQNVYVHRKGATQARVGQLGIIPGSQGTKSYIVAGLGNPQTFKSCSHGAGRIMGRRQAQRELNLEEEVKRLDDKGIIHSIRGIGDLDEASGAYKPIEEVMANQTDLVKIMVELEPLAVIKG